MKKTNLIKTVSILLLSVIVMLFATTVYADDNSTFTDLSSTLNTNTNNNSTNNPSNNPSNNPTNNPNVPTKNTNINNNTNKPNITNTSVYNNTDLPKTGLESSIPVALLVVIFGISAVYAYKKINDYKSL